MKPNLANKARQLVYIKFFKTTMCLGLNKYWWTNNDNKMKIKYICRLNLKKRD